MVRHDAEAEKGLFEGIFRGREGRMTGRIAMGMADAEKCVADYLSRMKGNLEEVREQILRKLAAMPASCRRGYLLALTGKSRMRAMDIHCLECAGWNRADVARCESVACALWAYRPFRARRRSMEKPAKGVSTARRAKA